MADDEPNPADVLRVLLATDNHLGVFERHRHRRKDSFVTFEEILEIAVKEEVDFILLGGDFFHDNKPSHSTLHTTMQLIREYCMGNKPIDFSVISDPSDTLSNKRFGRTNFDDANYNVAIPIFAIHGNHDDPTGEDHLSALDLLGTSNLINYFGKMDNCDEITVKPILLQKGCTKLALYGMGHIRDERLHRAFQQKQVQFLRPTENTQDWFNLFTLHQNRYDKGKNKNVITEEMLRGFFDLVMWGNEHECRIEPEKVQQGENSFDVTQPGSSVATSLTIDESKPKHVAVLEIYKTQYRLIKHKLHSIRPFHLEDVILLEEDLEKTTEEVTELLTAKVDELIQKNKETFTVHSEIVKRNPSIVLPLIRLRVDYTGGYPTINPQRFGGQFVDKVANATDIIIPLNRKQGAQSSGARSKGGTTTSSHGPVGGTISSSHINIDPESIATTIDDLVLKIIKEKNPLEILDESTMLEAVSVYVEKHEVAAIQDYVKDRVVQTQRLVWKHSKQKQNFTIPDVVTLVGEIKEQYNKQAALTTTVQNKQHDSPPPGTTARLHRTTSPESGLDVDNDDDDDDEERELMNLKEDAALTEAAAVFFEGSSKKGKPKVADDNDDALPTSGLNPRDNPFTVAEDLMGEEEMAQESVKSKSKGRGTATKGKAGGRGGSGRGRGRGNKSSSGSQLSFLGEVKHESSTPHELIDDVKIEQVTPASKRQKKGADPFQGSQQSLVEGVGEKKNTDVLSMLSKKGTKKTKQPLASVDPNPSLAKALARWGGKK